MKLSKIGVLVGAVCLPIGFAMGYFVASRKLEKELTQWYTNEIDLFKKDFIEGFEKASKYQEDKTEVKTLCDEEKVKAPHHDYSARYRGKEAKKPSLKELKERMEDELVEDEVVMGPQGEVLDASDDGFEEVEEPNRGDRDLIEVMDSKEADQKYPHYERGVFEYYAENGVLVDEDEAPVDPDDWELYIGDEVSQNLQDEKYEDSESVFVVNHRFCYVFEIIFVTEMYQET